MRITMHVGRGATLLIAAATCGCAAPRPAAPAAPVAVTATAESLAFPFIENDFALALARAREANLPLFVEVWAPWCHSCRFMRATVFTDLALAKHAGRFVWLSIDTEDERNATFLEQYPWEAVPTFEVLDPATESVAYRWLGAVDAQELVRRFDEAEQVMRAAGAASPRRPQTADAEVLELAMAGRDAECAQRALALLPTLAPGAAKAAVAATGLDCAAGASAQAPWRASALAALEPAVREALSYPGLLDDDRSGLYATLVGARDQQDDDAGGKSVATEWMDWLDAQAHSAANVEARAALDGYRVSAAMRAGAPERAVAPLETSERELPADYNPPARLAIVLREMGRYDEALAASDRALARVYGPRKLTLLDARATIYIKKGDRAAAKSTLAEAQAFAATLPKSQQPKGLIARIEERLKAD